MRKKIPGADMRVASAYFSIYAHQELREELDSAREFKFLFGDPRSIGNVDPGESDPKHFVITSQGDLGPAVALTQKIAARNCAEWVRRDNVHIRTMKSEFLHGKMFHLRQPEGPSAAVCGSSNFTCRGLGLGRGNRELNIVADENLRAELQEWFDKLWGGKWSECAEEKMLAALQRLGEDQSPQFVYFLTLYHLFREELEKGIQSGDDLRLSESDIWNQLHLFQQDAVFGVINRLVQWGGCVLADSVGLGKTYTALAVMKYFQNERVLVLCPKRLEWNWKRFLFHAPGGNPLEGDRFNYHVRAHTDLDRDQPDMDWSKYDLVVIDESHNFRNATADRRDENGNIIRRSRYNTLKNALRAGARSKVLMLSATPVNTSLKDIRNQIYLMAEDGDFESELGIQSVQTVVGVSQREFGLWEREGRGDKDQLIERLGPAFLKLMDAVTIARSRRHVEKHYREDLKRIGGFPEREPPENKRPHTDENGELSYAEIHRNIGQYGLSVYSPSKYLLDKSVLEAEKKKYNFDQRDREGFLIEMMRVNLLKRLESSVESFRQTLSRMIAKMRETEEKIRRFQQSQSDGEIDSAPEDDPEDDEFFVGRRRRYNLRELDGAKWAAELAVDRRILEEILARAEKVDAGRDEKLRTLKEILRKKAQEPNRKALVFTHYADTARYLRDNLLAFARANKLKIAMVVGAAAAAPAPDAKPLLGEKTEDDSGRDFAKILDNFAPVSRGRVGAGAEIDILIATDCVSEGQNLQDCDMVVNYDIHWNPVRIIQRFGRVDRIGSRAKKVRMTNFWPAMEMEEYLKLESRVKARMALADVAATGHDDLLAAQAKNLEENSEESVRAELTFRDEQLKRLQDRTMTADDLDGALASELTLTRFIDELRRFLDKNREQLARADKGFFAVVKSNPDIGAKPGIIFCLRRKEKAAKDDSPRLKGFNRTHPYFLVYVTQEGGVSAVRLGFTQARRILHIFSEQCRDKAEPSKDLCADFDAEIDNGENMESPNAALQSAVDDIVRKFTELTGRTVGPDGDGMLPQEGQIPQAADDFELISWLVIRDHPL